VSDTATHYCWSNNDLFLKVRLSPKSSSDKVLGLMGDRLKISIAAPPVDGQANAHLKKFLAKQFRLAKSSVTIVSGEKTKDKTICMTRPEYLPGDFLIDDGDHG